MFLDHVVLPLQVILLHSLSLLSCGPLLPPVCDECRVVGSASSLTLPEWGTDCNPCLMDYVPLVHQELQDKVLTAQHSADSRMRHDTSLCVWGA